MTRVLLIFVDGVGIGPNDPEVNPFARFKARIFRQFTAAPEADAYGRGLAQATDARLDVAGLPQSATGQTAILTGVNASKLLGHHLSGLPNKELKEILARESIFAKLNVLGRRATFANAYQPCFFTERPRRISATTAACTSAGIRLRTLEDLKSGAAVYHDFTNGYLRQLGYDLPLRNPEESGANLARLAARHDFTLYEHFITDVVGHARNMNLAVEVLQSLEEFLCSVVDHIDPEEQLVLLTSDHGNIEDLSRKVHTLNSVPTIAWGKGCREALRRISSIQDVTPAILSVLGTDGA
jgi:2,3-bisphosphoglycerate-independent phosphoglycerate mutase